MTRGDWVYVLKYPERTGQIVGVENYGWLLIDFGDEQLPYHPQDVELLAELNCYLGTSDQPPLS